MLKANMTEKKENFELALGTVISFLVGVLFSGASINGTPSFFNVAICGALNPMSAIALLTGSIIKYILTGTLYKNIALVCSMIFIIIGKTFTNVFNESRTSGIATFISVLASTTIINIIIEASILNIMFYVIYSILAGFSTYFLTIVMDSLRRKRVIDLQSTLSCSYAVVYIILIATLSSFDMGLLNIGRIIGIAVTITAVYHYKYIGGILCGALTTCGVFLSSYELGVPIVLLSVSALLTGYIRVKNTLLTGVIFNIISIILIVMMGYGTNTIYCIIDLILATAIYMGISPLISDKWIVVGKNEHGLSEIIASRMDFLASSISAVRDDSKKISLFLSNSVEKAEYEGEDSEESATEKMVARLLALRFSENQKLLFEQIKITEEIISSAGEKINVRYSEAISSSVEKKLRKYNFNTSNIIAYYNSRNKLLIELYFDLEQAPTNCVRICDLISDELNIPLDFSKPVRSGKEVRIRIFEETRYKLESYVSSLCAINSSETGDTSDIFSDGMGNSFAVLSDGMGSGKSAALESKMVVSMFQKLVVSGVEYSSAIKMINSIMLNKSQNEAFATLDVVKIDLDTCDLTVIKSGASATIIKHKNKVIKITAPTFPIGIMQEADAFTQNFDFEKNDIVIMLSDGISENEYKFIKEQLLSEKDLEKIVKEICDKSEVFSGGQRRDDVTVIGMRVY